MWGSFSISSSNLWQILSLKNCQPNAFSENICSLTHPRPLWSGLMVFHESIFKKLNWVFYLFFFWKPHRGLLFHKGMAAQMVQNQQSEKTGMVWLITYTEVHGSHLNQHVSHWYSDPHYASTEMYSTLSLKSVCLQTKKNSRTSMTRTSLLHQPSNKDSLRKSDC